VRPFVSALNKYVPPAGEVAKAEVTRKSKTSAEVESQTKADHQPKKATLSSAEVKQAQEALQAKGYDTGGIDGIIGPKTRQAIRDYQAAEKIQVTGTLNAETASRLGVRAE
jgi:peptidoglycan hydrolase-like protein with peptidoglycan-binding domain